jgi:hypothetical protein
MFQFQFTMIRILSESYLCDLSKRHSYFVLIISRSDKIITLYYHNLFYQLCPLIRKVYLIKIICRWLC